MIINAFKGIHNTVSSRDIPDDALADAINVDLTDSGAVLKRFGSELSSSIAITSSFSTQNERGFIVSGGVLKEVNADLSLSNLSSSTATEFTEWGNVIFTNDGLRIDGQSVVNLKLPNPATQLTVTTTSGDLPEGKYSFTYTYRSGTLESGSGPIVTIDVPENGGVYVSPPEQISGYEAVIYMTDCNGTVYFDKYGVQLPEVYQLAESFPVCQKIAFHNNRLYCSEYLATGQTVIRFSHVYYFHLFDFLVNTIIVPGEVRSMMSTGEYLIIATDSEIYAYNGTLSLLANYGVPEGKSMVKRPDGSIVIYSKRGFCSAMPFQSLTEKRVSLPTGDHCVLAYLNRRGMNQVVALHNGDSTAFNSF